MNSVQQKKLVLFGAGKIGRSFIGQLFSRGGYEVVFIDIFKAVIDELNLRRNYNVIIKSDKEEVINIKNVRGVHVEDSESVIDEIATAGILAVSVGQNGLKTTIPLIAKGLEKRFTIDKNSALDIIIAENLRNADEYFSERLKSLLSKSYAFEKLVGLVETSIGKMVPIMLKKDIEEDILQVFAEPYNTLILDKKAFKNAIPDIQGLAPKENMKAWVDRKLFIHNLGHAAAAYIGYLYNQDFIYIYEALSIPAIYNFVRKTMLCSAEILLKKYPDEFTIQQLTEHVDDLLTRFQNKSLGDTIFRVGCDLMRKLGPEDRLVGAIKTAMHLNLSYSEILFALVCGFYFKARDEQGILFSGDLEFHFILEKGIQEVLSSVCGFSANEIKVIEKQVVNKITIIQSGKLKEHIDTCQYCNE